mgnify:CR=1 FL=1
MYKKIILSSFIIFEGGLLNGTLYSVEAEERRGRDPPLFPLPQGVRGFGMGASLPARRRGEPVRHRKGLQRGYHDPHAH